MEEIKLLAEIIEQCGQAGKYLSASEIAMNDGDIAECQKQSKKAQELLKTMVRDVFKEFEDEYGDIGFKTNDYDYPNNMELIKALNELVYNLGVLVGLIIEKMDNIKANVINQTKVGIATVNEIYLALYEN